MPVIVLKYKTVFVTGRAGLFDYNKRILGPDRTFHTKPCSGFLNEKHLEMFGNNENNKHNFKMEDVFIRSGQADKYSVRASYN